ncbi:uncharacterized protein LOC117327138 isoform X2 [Pecten maximus]|uniref:uncharacterized protein LOC117327138 isoform X2 n=1 Tax=Pecten maximus TaxID=6579 RepID=UPI001458E013|nr:uncharacterized protein LOC117327138 isoform X2 [Pecten maximus]
METIKVTCFILLLNIQDIRMCEDGSVTSDKVILDTHMAGESGETTCSCSVDSTSIITIYIEYYGNGLNPNTSGCGSEVVAIENRVEHREGHYQCNTSPLVPIYIRPVTITWNGTLGGDSKYCLNITGVLLPAYPNATFTITCYKPEATSTSLPTSKSTTTAAETTEQTKSRTKTTIISEATDVSTSDHGTSNAGQTTSQPTSSIPDDTSTQRLEDSFPLIIVIPAAAGGFVLIVIIIIIVVVCCRKSGKKGRESYIDDTIDPYGTSHPMSNAAANNDDDEGDGMKNNILYETSGDILPNGNYSTVQVPQSNSPEVEYAKENQKNTPKTNEESNENKIELSNLNGTGNDVYAVVNKPKQVKNAQDSATATYTTSEGLVYVKVESGGLKNSEPKPITSDTRQRNDDNNDTDNVAYADVVVT